jgi:prepilin-type N-terminal cleavage/methylation domain-containing protein
MQRSSRAAFTLIELMIVVVIIGALAAIAIPTFMNTKDKAYRATLNEDIRRFATVEESYYGDVGHYADDAAIGFTPTQGNVVNMGASGTGGWSAEIYSTQDTRAYRCGLQIGNVAPVSGNILTESQVYCYVP